MIEKLNKDIYYYMHIKKLENYIFENFDFLNKFYNER